MQLSIPSIGSAFKGSGFWVQRFKGSGFWVQRFKGSGFRVQGLSILDFGFRILDFIKIWVQSQGSGFRVPGYTRFI
jgi:hypothetical protein